MKKYKQLLEERAVLYSQQAVIVEQARNEKREMTKEEQTCFEDLQLQVDTVYESIEQVKTKDQIK